MTESTKLSLAVSETRAFTRFFTGFAGVLSDRLHRSRFSLPQARVIHEIATGPANTAAADMARALRMDAGQLSRVLAGLESAGLIERTPTENNAKQLAISLTEQGDAVFSALDEMASRRVRDQLAKLPDPDLARLVGAMRLITRLLGHSPHPAASLVLRDLEPGDIGWVIAREAALYAGEYGWNGDFETMVTRILADFAETRNPKRERCWIAEVDGERVGAVFLMAKDRKTAQLRLLHVEHAARGHGIGRALVDACVGFAQSAGYSRIELWTNDILKSARRIYIHAGFVKIAETPHVSFGKSLIGQTWARDL